MQTVFTPVESIGGGVLIGLAAVLLMALHGRVAGVSGIISGVLPPYFSRIGTGDIAWRVAFLGGLLISPMAFLATFGRPPVVQVSGTPVLWLASGLIVGAGVTFGAGCPSGHGICGLARVSGRSLVAVATFMATAAATVFVVRHIVGG